MDSQIVQLMQQMHEMEDRFAQSEASNAALTAALQNTVDQQNQINSIAQAIVGRSISDQSRCLVDTRGIGRFGTSSGKAEDFVQWCTKTINLVLGISPVFEQVVHYVEDSVDSITDQNTMGDFGPMGLVDQIGHIHEKVKQFHTLIQQLTEKEPFDIPNNCGNGLEVWRRIVRRYDPTTASRKRN